LLLAVHISDGLLSAPWLAGGFVLAAVLAVMGAWKIKEVEIPRVALLTAAFFVASSIHVPVVLGPVKMHLLLNGLLGVVLGFRAGLAIAVGLVMQGALVGHGGYSTLGVTCCVMTIPALAAGQAYRALHQLAWLRHAWFRAALVGGSVALWALALEYCLVWLSINGIAASRDADVAAVNRTALQPAVLAGVLGLAVLAAGIERRLESSAEFALGLLLGQLSVFLTLLLNAVVLVLGGQEDWHFVALVQFVGHLPIALVEGIVLGFTVSFLARVKPEMLGAVEETT